MVTICELKIEAKSLGLKGYSKLKKADLMKLIDGEDKPKPKPKAKPKPPTGKPKIAHPISFWSLPNKSVSSNL